MTKSGIRATVTLADIGSLPHYSGDLDVEPKPASVSKLIEQVQAADAIVIATPEYNYSIPGVLKNAIDWLSRPAFRSPLANKPTGIVGASRGQVGTARAQGHLRQVLGATMTPVFLHPDILVGSAQTKFDDTGALVDVATREHLAAYLTAFLAWLDGAREATKRVKLRSA